MGTFGDGPVVRRLTLELKLYFDPALVAAREIYLKSLSVRSALSVTENTKQIGPASRSQRRLSCRYSRRLCRYNNTRWRASVATFVNVWKRPKSDMRRPSPPGGRVFRGPLLFWLCRLPRSNTSVGAEIVDDRATSVDNLFATGVGGGRASMLFNSFAFLLGFLPAAIVIYAFADRFPRARMPVLIALSVFFYDYWDPRFLALLIASILGNWLIALLYDRTRRGYLITLAIIGNPAILGVFKYSAFFAKNVATIAGFEPYYWHFALPLGISFFTVHQIMYLVDLKRGKAPIYPLERYALYILFLSAIDFRTDSSVERGDAMKASKIFRRPEGVHSQAGS